MPKSPENFFAPETPEQRKDWVEKLAWDDCEKYMQALCAARGLRKLAVDSPITDLPLPDEDLIASGVRLDEIDWYREAFLYRYSLGYPYYPN